MQDASKLIETVRENAKRFGVTLDDQAALEAAMRLEERQAAEGGTKWAQANEHLRGAFRDTPPAESARWFGQVAANFRQDPIGTLAWLGSQTGMHPAQIAQQIYQRYGNAPMQQQFQSQEQAVAAYEAVINRVVPTLDDFAKFEADVEEVLRKNAIKRTGDPETDLKAAYKEARRRDARLTKEQRLDKSFRRIYDKANSRGA